MSINVICVYKKGNGFTRGYIKALKTIFNKLATLPFEFYCFDNGKYKGWWNKLEIFTMKGKCLYIDLDTVILSGIDDLISITENCSEKEFYMLTPFNLKKRFGSWASGIMAWNGNYSFLYEKFLDTHISTGCDQIFITDNIPEHIQIKSIQEAIGGIYSFKNHCREGLPDDASVICFHGNTRPKDIMDSLDWMKDWKEGYQL